MTKLTATVLDVADLARLALVLDEAGRPSADLTEPRRVFVRFDADRLVGFGGLDGDGRIASSGRSSSLPIIADEGSGERWSQVLRIRLATPACAAFIC